MTEQHDEPVAWLIETEDERWLAFEQETPDAIAIPFTETPLYTRSTPSSDMVEDPRPYPHATGEGAKYQECYSFDDGSLTVRTTGYGERCGTGWLCFPEDALEQEQDDETGKWYQVANLANSELIFLRDTLNAIFPSRMAAKDAELAELKAAVMDYNSALRSCSQVAKRNGENTNWDNLEKRITAALEKHHTTWCAHWDGKI